MENINNLNYLKNQNTKTIENNEKVINEITKITSDYKQKIKNLDRIMDELNNALQLTIEMNKNLINQRLL